ncbi:MAG: hypothetical protein ACLFQX_08270 [Candidatus Kapaibacterium sp.]
MKAETSEIIKSLESDLDMDLINVPQFDWLPKYIEMQRDKFFTIAQVKVWAREKIENQKEAEYLKGICLL